jgi:hypothetical protein
MAYNQNIPQPTDELSVSQGDLLNNFMAIYNAFNQNHVPFNSGTPLQGLHAFVEMPNQSGSVPSTIANEVGLFCNTSTFTTQPELFFAKQLGSSAPPALTTPYEISSSNYIANGGWSRLPSGILLKWGTFSLSGATGTVTYPVAVTIPAFAHVFTVYCTSTSVVAAYFSVNTLLNASFNITANITGSSGFYLAIGY